MGKYDKRLTSKGVNMEQEAKTMETMVQDHEQRIIKLERNYGEVQKELAAVQTSQSKIENMIYSQNTEQKKLIEGHQTEQKELLNTLLSHTLGIKKDSNAKRWEVIISIVGGGGLFYGIIELIKYLIGG